MLAVLGISCGFHDSSSCIIDFNGNILFAASEERFSRSKGDSSFPQSSIDSAIEYAKVNDLQVSKIVVHENILKQSSLKAINILLRPVSFFKSSSTLKAKLNSLNRLKVKLGLTSSDIFFSDHHLSHAYSSIATADGDEGLVLILDAIGEYSSGLIGVVSQKKIKSFDKLNINNSLGLIYSAITVFCGFKVLSGEYKLMGLAPYGRPVYINQLEEVFGRSSEITPNINDINIYSPRLTSDRLEGCLGFPPRDSSQPLLQKYADLAASVQLYLEHAVFALVNESISRFNLSPGCSLFLGGGIALNCKLNYSLSNHFNRFFNEIWAFPASGDAGSSIGACFNYLKNVDQKLEHGLQFQNCFLGPEHNNTDLVDRLKQLSFSYLDFESSIPRIISKLQDGEVGAIFSGRSEFGPRALGHRSIIGNPSNPSTLSFINSEIKSREDFRPLAPVMLKSYFRKYFQINNNVVKMAEYMLVLSKSFEKSTYLPANDPDSIVLPASSGHSSLSAVVHLDGTARIQLIDDNDNSTLSQILSQFSKTTGIPALVNTSFNVRGEPIVESVDDAINCFKQTRLSFLVLGDFILFREDQNPLVLLGGTSKVADD